MIVGFHGGVGCVLYTSLVQLGRQQTQSLLTRRRDARDVEGLLLWRACMHKPSGNENLCNKRIGQSQDFLWIFLEINLIWRATRSRCTSRWKAARRARCSPLVHVVHAPAVGRLGEFLIVGTSTVRILPRLVTESPLDRNRGNSKLVAME